MNILNLVKGTPETATELLMIGLYGSVIRSISNFAMEVNFNPRKQKQIEIVQI